VVSLKLLRQFVAPEVTGCPSALIDSKIVTKAIEFCEQSEAWRYDLTPIDLVALQAGYSLNLPVETQVVGIKSLFDDGHPVYPKSEQQIDADWPKLNTTFGYNSNANNSFQPWRQRTEAQAIYFYQSTPGTVRLFPIPESAKTGGLTGTVVVKPLPDGTLIDEDLYNQFYDAIASGAKADLMAMPGKDWTNLEMVAYYSRKFTDGIDEARGKEARSGQVKNNTTHRSRSYS
jgi:hypothetical protein